MFNAIENFPCIQRKAEWAMRVGTHPATHNKQAPLWRLALVSAVGIECSRLLTRILDFFVVPLSVDFSPVDQVEHEFR